MRIWHLETAPLDRPVDNPLGQIKGQEIRHHGEKNDSKHPYLLLVRMPPDITKEAFIHHQFRTPGAYSAVFYFSSVLCLAGCLFVYTDSFQPREKTFREVTLWLSIKERRKTSV
ncbi:hypothetical protein NAC44_00015 [Allorhizobium sp. BGMRC 0089]|uniref:hypothetical protein n=1 Tax=Allorhizobium sonneratiae TaxID=2934936 RepID=UPI0020342D2B|nr:hypothetical protein [Allorhizobium sonneratiae]